MSRAVFCYKNLFSNQMRGPQNLLFCATQRCLFGRELSVRKKPVVSRISVRKELNVMTSGQSLHDTYLIRTSQRTRQGPTLHSARQQRRDMTCRERREADKNVIGCQDSWRGINRTYVELRTTQAVNLNLKLNAISENKAIYGVICANE